jgi:hypothetical protein
MTWLDLAQRFMPLWDWFRFSSADTRSPSKLPNTRISYQLTAFGDRTGENEKLNGKIQGFLYKLRIVPRGYTFKYAPRHHPHPSWLPPGKAYKVSLSSYLTLLVQALKVHKVSCIFYFVSSYSSISFFFLIPQHVRSPSSPKYQRHVSRSDPTRTRQITGHADRTHPSTWPSALSLLFHPPPFKACLFLSFLIRPSP